MKYETIKTPEVLYTHIIVMFNLFNPINFVKKKKIEEGADTY